MRVLGLVPKSWQVTALIRSADQDRLTGLSAAGATPFIGDLDAPDSIRRLAGWADRVLHLAPPPTYGEQDPRTRHLLQVLSRATAPCRLVYMSTSGVYGDCQGERFDETRATAASTDRARRRVDAEQQVRRFGRLFGTQVTLLRVPGIYAVNRLGGHPRERLARETPVLVREDDVFTNHIQADDLARACLLALMRGRPQRILHVCDDSELLMGDYFDLAADLCGMRRPPRISREQAQVLMSSLQLSFMSESRRLINHRLKKELGLRLRYPHPVDGLMAG
ncbi:NAD-dependent epimerase/dehydratase family protein [Paucibacter sp. hw1]|uniref:NAD-dependent epimerase/dehydratase family protein n=2 Tax=Roseateles koreensis TaxID=2987526 RepID=A0ABT5KQ73_9BURK|nr:NAD-dependent epimerase/dehydratase family protein [Roseateles koreensis]MDC8785070.1 NAD-dependent epimerase/dehydratase family protein [Roseateles koreensis]